MIYINQFLHGVKTFTITNDKIINENGQELKPTITTLKDIIKNKSKIFYKKINSDLFIESLTANAEDIKQFIIKNNLHE